MINSRQTLGFFFSEKARYNAMCEQDGGGNLVKFSLLAPVKICEDTGRIIPDLPQDKLPAPRDSFRLVAYRNKNGDVVDVTSPRRLNNVIDTGHDL